MPKFVTIQNLEQYNSKINPRIQDLEQVSDLGYLVNYIKQTQTITYTVELDGKTYTCKANVDPSENLPKLSDIEDYYGFSQIKEYVETLKNTDYLTLSGGNLTGSLTINNQKVATEDFVSTSINNLNSTYLGISAKAESAKSADSVAWDNVSDKPSTFTPSNHTHDDRYYTESEIDTKLSDKANATDLSNYLRLSGGNVTGNLTVQNKNVATEDFVNDSINNINLGAGLEVGDIALAPLGIDETDNCRRYLNGQVILQSQFVAFTEKLKHAITLYPNLATTEQNWQSAVTLSPLGQCGKFVIDDEAGTIRLPKVVNVMGALDLSSIGELQSAGLPNITGNAGVYQGWFDDTHGVAFYKLASTPSIRATEGWEVNSEQVGFDASRSNSIYGNSTTVQQEAIKYPYFIQVATSNSEDAQIDTQVRLNNPFSLFMPYWSPIELNNLSWLRSNKQWNNGSVYTSAYEFLLSKYNSGTEQTETIAGVSVTYILTDNGMKIITDKSKYDALISASGSAWFFVLDTVNTQFILPYTNGFAQFGSEPGKFTEAGLPNITGEILPIALNSDASGGYCLSCLTSGAFSAVITDYNCFKPSGLDYISGQNAGGKFDASRSSSVYGKSPTVQPNSVTGYLYFYVGEVEQDANIIATSGLAESISRKLDIEGASSVGMPSERYVNLSVGASGTSYTAPADGWFYVNGNTTSPSGYLHLEYLRNGLVYQNTTSVVGYSVPCFIPALKGNSVRVDYADTSISILRFIYANGAK